jgi:hypothetical protein
MATITISQFQRLGRDADGQGIPIADDYVGGETMTAAGASDPMASGAMFVRIATDTAYTVDVYGAGTEALLPANSVDFFPVEAGQVLTFTAVS